MKETTRIITARMTFITKEVEPTDKSGIKAELMAATGADDIEIMKVQDFIIENEE